MDFHKILSYCFLVLLLNAVNGNASNLLCFLNVACFLKYPVRINHFGNLLSNNVRGQSEAQRSVFYLQLYIDVFKKIVGDDVAANQSSTAAVLFCLLFSQ